MAKRREAHEPQNATGGFTNYIRSGVEKKQNAPCPNRYCTRACQFGQFSFSSVPAPGTSNAVAILAKAACKPVSQNARINCCPKPMRFSARKSGRIKLSMYGLGKIAGVQLAGSKLVETPEAGFAMFRPLTSCS